MRRKIRGPTACHNIFFFPQSRVGPTVLWKVRSRPFCGGSSCRCIFSCIFLFFPLMPPLLFFRSTCILLFFLSFFFFLYFASVSCTASCTFFIFFDFFLLFRFLTFWNLSPGTRPFLPRTMDGWMDGSTRSRKRNALDVFLYSLVPYRRRFSSFFWGFPFFFNIFFIFSPPRRSHRSEIPPELFSIFCILFSTL